jgi:hypothetical protein
MTEPAKCKCGVKLDDRGVCPALCEPLQPPLPKYTGPTTIGLTHVGRMARALIKSNLIGATCSMWAMSPTATKFCIAAK